MHGPAGPPSRRRLLLLSGVVRWTIATIIGATVTAGLFVSMTRMIDGSWILDLMIRVFPLEQTEFVDPCEVWEQEQTLVTIEGTVGYLGRAVKPAGDAKSGCGIDPLPDVVVIVDHRVRQTW